MEREVWAYLRCAIAAGPHGWFYFSTARCDAAGRLLCEQTVGVTVYLRSWSSKVTIDVKSTT